MKKLLKKVLVISDNLFLTENFIDIIKEIDIKDVQFFFACSFNNSSFPEQVGGFNIGKINIKKEYQKILIQEFDMVISLHCKQLFPVELVSHIKCINIHPGLNPFNRGWFPQVFSIINGLPLGATIHEIDEELDHGPIIAQKEVEVYSWDTSLTAYNKVLQAELELVRLNLISLIQQNYKTVLPVEEGNLNLKKDFNDLCSLDLEEEGTLKYFLNKLRALTHGTYSNGYYYDAKTGKKVYIEVKLQVEN